MNKKDSRRKTITRERDADRFDHRVLEIIGELVHIQLEDVKNRNRYRAVQDAIDLLKEYLELGNPAIIRIAIDAGIEVTRAVAKGGDLHYLRPGYQRVHRGKR